MSKLAGIYIHIPFCERKCTYCNFNTTDFARDLAARYVEAVGKEIACCGQSVRGLAQSTGEDGVRRPDGRLVVDSIFFGGGTPSMLGADQVAALVEACHAAFLIEPDSEVTIEINPGSFSSDKLRGWLAAGINRASVGTQSFIDRELVSLSRTHSANDARRTVEALREAGFRNISLDLIAGLPLQTKEDWEFNLREALLIRPEHLSLYLLEIKEGTQLFNMVRRGACPRPDDDLAADMYRMIRAATQAEGYEHYEISNFALRSSGMAEVSGGCSPKKNHLRSKHNMKYWTGAPFYGMGCGAHSYDGRARRVNVKKTESYIESIIATGSATAESTELSAMDRAIEALFMGLRVAEGIDLAEFRDEYGLDVEARYREELDRLSEAELIERSDGRLFLTVKGMLLSNEVFVSFV